MGGITGKLGTWGTTPMPNEFGDMPVPSNDSGICGRDPRANGGRLLELELEWEMKLLVEVATELD